MPLVLNGTTGVQDNSGAFVRGTSVASTSGTSIDFTGIPSWVKRVTVMFKDVSISGSALTIIQLGDSGGIETSGYSGSSSSFNTLPSATNWTSGIIVNEISGAADLNSGIATIALLDLATNTWVANGLFAYTNGLGTTILAGHKALSATLDRVRITTSNGTDTFDAGLINILYE